MRLLLCVCVAVSHATSKLPSNLFEDTKRIPKSNIYDLLDIFFPDRWMEVPLNHFNLFDNRTWQMRYKVSKGYFELGHPIFIEIGGEWTISGSNFVDGQLGKLAERHRGMLVETEHRYYGKSLPFGTNFTTGNLQYLQIEQTLEDIAYFIEHFKAITPGTENSKVIIHGCSYPGMLATWMRLRFPNIVDIAYASSAPLGVGLTYTEYFEVVTDVYANVSSECINTIRAGFRDTQELMATKEGRKRVRNALRKWDCGNVDKMSCYDILRQYTKILNVMYDPVHYEDVSCLVLAMDTDDTEPFERLANLITLKSKDRGSCSDSDKAESEKLGVARELTENERNTIAWGYQTCTEMGTFTTLNRTNSRHPVEMDLSVHDAVEGCVQDFGEMMTENVLVKGAERITRRYGGNKPKVTKVLRVQGTHDPWKYLAVPEAPVLIFEGSHCADVTERQNDPKELLDLRKRIRDQISQWIEETS